MAEESIEVRLARLDERLMAVLGKLDEAKEDQRNQQSSMSKIDNFLIMLDNRVKNVEESLAKASPTIDEFITIKHKVSGAGFIGKGVWVVLGGTISMLFAMRETIYQWFSR